MCALCPAPRTYLDELAVARHVVAMTPAEILGEIQQLPLQEQSRIFEALRDLLLRQDGPSASSTPNKARHSDLVHAARALRPDYESDPELTAFTALDGEDFHAAR
jgi:hypothetical protein